MQNDRREVAALNVSFIYVTCYNMRKAQEVNYNSFPPLFSPLGRRLFDLGSRRWQLCRYPATR
jgi:hypothetical protein